MKDIQFTNGHTYKVKNSWEELSASEFLQVLDLITLFFSGEITLLQFRVRLLSIVTGIKLRLHGNKEKADQQAENIYRISRVINFPLQVKYKNDKALSKMKKDIRDQLSRYLPEELEPTPEVRWAEKAEKQIVPDLVFASNLIPVIGNRRHTYHGYSFSLQNNILVTSLTTGQFIDAQTIAAKIQDTGDKSLLNVLAAILYAPKSYYGLNAPAAPFFYSAQQAASRACKFECVDMATKKAIFINFNAIQSYLFSSTKYNILFNETAPSQPKPKHNLGLGSVAHSLIKSGYGDIENSNLVKFFEIMYSDLVSNVTSLYKQGLTIDKIAEQTGLSMSKINQII